MDFTDWVTLGETAIKDLLSVEHAATRHEMEAKLSEQAIDPPICRRSIQPHVLTHSLKSALQSGTVVKVEGVTRGGRAVATYNLSDTRRRGRAVADASARKRLLQARFNGWAVGGVSTAFAGTMGASGEIALQISMKSAATNPAVPAAVAKPEVANPRLTQLFGLEVPIGPLDNGMILLSNSSVIHIPVEIKNRRQWIYSDAPELFQILSKAALMQQQSPDVNICPVLVCRRAHWTTFNLMKDLGGHVIPTKEQYVHPEIDERLVAEVRNELGYDLLQTQQPRPLLTSNFANTLPRNAYEQSQKWKQFAPTLATHFEVLRTLKRSRRRAFEALLSTAAGDCGIPTTAKWRTGTASA